MRIRTRFQASFAGAALATLSVVAGATAQSPGTAESRAGKATAKPTAGSTENNQGIMQDYYPHSNVRKGPAAQPAKPPSPPSR